MQSTMATLATKVHVEEMLQPLEKNVHDFGTKVDEMEKKFEERIENIEAHMAAKHFSLGVSPAGASNVSTESGSPSTVRNFLGERSPKRYNAEASPWTPSCIKLKGWVQIGRTRARRAWCTARAKPS